MKINNFVSTNNKRTVLKEEEKKNAEHKKKTNYRKALETCYTRVCISIRYTYKILCLVWC